MMALEYGSIFLNSFSRNLRGKITFTTMYLDALLERNMDTFIRSVEYALIVAIVGSLIGILLSYYIERRKIKFGGVLTLLLHFRICFREVVLESDIFWHLIMNR